VVDALDPWLGVREKLIELLELTLLVVEGLILEVVEELTELVELALLVVEELADLVVDGV
jgi:hypothetical protein